MPNWVKVVIESKPHVIDALMVAGDPNSEHEEERQARVDFNLLVPQPANIERGGCSGNHKPGEVCWYEWNLANWGTKWNAVRSVRLSDTSVSFETAWAAPWPVLKALSWLCPEDYIGVTYADEDLGFNLADLVMLNGRVALSRELVAGSDEACDFASRHWYGKSWAELRAEWDAEERKAQAAAQAREALAAAQQPELLIALEDEEGS